MKKVSYERVQMDVTEFELLDVITTSGGDDSSSSDPETPEMPLE